MDNNSKGKIGFEWIALIALIASIVSLVISTNTQTSSTSAVLFSTSLSAPSENGKCYYHYKVGGFQFCQPYDSVPDGTKYGRCYLPTVPKPPCQN